MAVNCGIELPYDIWDEIIFFIENRDDLVELCLVNSTIGRIATTRLYRKVSFDHLSPLHNLHRSISRRPLLAQQVVAMSVNLDGLLCRVVPPSAICAGMRLLFHLLHKLVNMKEFTLVWNAQGHVYFESLEQCFSRSLGQLQQPLSRLTLHGIPAIHALRTQVALVELELRYEWMQTSHNFDDVPAEAIRYLRRLTCDLPGAATLGKGRALEAFHLHRQYRHAIIPEQLPECLQHLQFSASSMRMAEFDIQKLAPDTIGLISRALPDLVDLILTTSNDDTVLQMILPGHISEVTSGFRGFRRLECVEVHFPAFRLTGTVQLSEALKQLSLACRSLHTFTAAIEFLEDSDVLPVYVFSKSEHSFEPGESRVEWGGRRKIYDRTEHLECTMIPELMGFTRAGDLLYEGYDGQLGDIDSTCHLM
ncbi:hypothetical protein CALCODRAFT_337798 [Calocera cornea HHB12733]|uniref:F-box domain-containing protein n=1 Tax=Calocera cornea HHB12733 TaxID=1353952 RepID=A0A165EZH7_9BASI|nr:hypothetical protein CALCODRAFT_337798 [Calocera cornea HHB12733]